MSLEIRPARADGGDDDGIWRVLEPAIRAGETYALPRDLSRADALAYWRATENEVFVAVELDEPRGEIVGTYLLRPNQRGGGAHVCNCGYMTAPWAAGRGVASAMCTHSLAYAPTRGYRAMQFNLVISTNERAVRLWQRLGFDVVGRLPAAFHHPSLGYVDALVMYRALV
jgi:ribosomal protein S18 acetylase RimI-like enzyme